MCRDRTPRPHLQNTPPEHDRRAGFDSAYCGLQLGPLQSVRVCTDNSMHVLCDQCCASFAAKRISLLCRLLSGFSLGICVCVCVCVCFFLLFLCICDGYSCCLFRFCCCCLVSLFVVEESERKRCSVWLTLYFYYFIASNYLRVHKPRSSHLIFFCFTASTLFVSLPCSFFLYFIYLVVSFHISFTLFVYIRLVFCFHISSIPCLFLFICLDFSFSYSIYLVCFSASSLFFLFHISSTVFFSFFFFLFYISSTVFVSLAFSVFSIFDLPCLFLLRFLSFPYFNYRVCFSCMFLIFHVSSTLFVSLHLPCSFFSTFHPPCFFLFICLVLSFPHFIYRVCFATLFLFLGFSTSTFFLHISLIASLSVLLYIYLIVSLSVFLYIYLIVSLHLSRSFCPSFICLVCFSSSTCLFFLCISLHLPCFFFYVYFFYFSTSTLFLTLRLTCVPFNTYLFPLHKP